MRVHYLRLPSNAPVRSRGHGGFPFACIVVQPEMEEMVAWSGLVPRLQTLGVKTWGQPLSERAAQVPADLRGLILEVHIYFPTFKIKYLCPCLASGCWKSPQCLFIWSLLWSECCVHLRPPPNSHNWKNPSSTAVVLGGGAPER